MDYNAIITKLQLNDNLPVVIVNNDGHITYINSAFEELFLWSKDDILNQSVLSIIPKDMHDAHNIGFSRFTTTAKPTLLNQEIELKALKKNGDEFMAIHYISAIKDNKKWIIGANISLDPQKNGQS